MILSLWSVACVAFGIYFVLFYYNSFSQKLKATCFRNLTALIQQERETRNFPTINKIVSALDCQNYYGFLASLVRKIIKSMTGSARPHLN